MSYILAGQRSTGSNHGLHLRPCPSHRFAHIIPRTVLIAFSIVAIIAIVGLWLLGGQSVRRLGARPIVLAALPLALLFPAVAVPTASMATIRAFQTIAASGQAPTRIAAAMARDITRTLSFAATAAVIVMFVAAWLQRRASANAADDAVEPAVKATWGRWILAGSPLLLVPTVWLMHAVGQAGLLTMRAAAAITDATASPAALASTHAVYVDAISKYLIAASLGGVFICPVIVICAIANLLIVRLSGPPGTLERVAYAAAAILAVPIAWDLTTLWRAIHAFESTQ